MLESRGMQGPYLLPKRLFLHELTGGAMYDPYERCRRSMDRAQAAYDAQLPPSYYEKIPTCPHCGDELDSDYICVDCGAVEPVGEQSREDWLEQEADRKRDEL